MAVIDVDFDVFKALTIRRETESDTYNDVLRRLLELPSAEKKTREITAAPKSGMAWVSKGVTFPDGTEFRATYKGRVVSAKVARARLVGDGDKLATSLSQAARFVTNTSVDGWTFWDVKRPGDLDWRKAADLRSSPG